MLWWSCLAFDGRDVAERPVLSGPVETVVSADDTFEIHFTREGDDAPAGGDAPDGLPEVVHAVLDGLALGKESFEAEGWRPLVGDLGVGGSDRIDVYIVDIEANGYANAVPGTDGYSCYMRVDGGLGTLGRITESVALHELHHCIEYRYGTTHSWMHEAAATHAQYAHVLDPALELALGVLYGERLGHPERAIDDLDGRYEYAAFLAHKFWAEYLPSQAPLPELWEAVAEHGDDWEAALAAEAQRRWDLPLTEALLEYATWNAFACADDDGGHYDPQVLPCIADVGVPVEEWTEGPITLTHEAAPYTAAYVEIPGDGRGLEVRCAGDGRARLVGVQEDGTRGAHSDDVDGIAALDITEPTMLLVALGEGRPLDLTCELTRYDSPLVAADTASCSCGSATQTSTWGLLLLLPWLRRRR